MSWCASLPSFQHREHAVLCPQYRDAKIANDLMSAEEILLIMRDDGCNIHMWNYDRLPLLTVAPVNHMHVKVSHNQGIPGAQMSPSHETMFA